MSKKTGNPRGRPIVFVEKMDEIFQLAKIHCSNSEIAAVIGCDSSLLSKPNYSAVIAKGKEEGKMSLRRKMFESAMNGNTTMLIWLSKNILGYSDHETIKHGVDTQDGFKITVEDYTTPNTTQIQIEDKNVKKAGDCY